MTINHNNITSTQYIHIIYTVHCSSYYNNAHHCQGYCSSRSCCALFYMTCTVFLEVKASTKQKKELHFSIFLKIAMLLTYLQLSWHLSHFIGSHVFWVVQVFWSLADPHTSEASSHYGQKRFSWHLLPVYLHRAGLIWLHRKGGNHRHDRANPIIYSVVQC